MPVCLVGSPCNLYSNLITRTLPASLNLHICPEEGKNMDSQHYSLNGSKRPVGRIETTNRILKFTSDKLVFSSPLIQGVTYVM